MDKTKRSIDWFFPWVVGCMFTLGYVGAIVGPDFLTGWSTLTRFASGILLFFIWPAILGIALGGGF